MSVGVDNGILILAVHGSPLFVSISPTLVDRSWSCQSAQALRFASALCAGSAGNQPSRHGLAFAFDVKLAPPRVMDRIFKPPFSMAGAISQDRNSLSPDMFTAARAHAAPRPYWNVIRSVRLKVDVLSLRGWFVGFALF